MSVQDVQEKKVPHLLILVFGWFPLLFGFLMILFSFIRFLSGYYGESIPGYAYALFFVALATHILGLVISTDAKQVLGTTFAGPLMLAVLALVASCFILSW